MPLAPNPTPPSRYLAEDEEIVRDPNARAIAAPVERSKQQLQTDGGLPRLMRLQAQEEAEGARILQVTTGFGFSPPLVPRPIDVPPSGLSMPCCRRRG